MVVLWMVNLFPSVVTALEHHSGPERNDSTEADSPVTHDDAGFDLSVHSVQQPAVEAFLGVVF